MPSSNMIDRLLLRFGGATPELLHRVLKPYHLSITHISPSTDDKKILFRAIIPAEIDSVFETGTTGKVVPRDHVEGAGVWRELLKGRVLEGDRHSILGEFHLAGSGRLKEALKLVKVGDYFEIDPFGVTSKVESALCEAALFQKARDSGFVVTRMPENVAKHLGTQNYYDFKLERDGRIYRLELKSLWGTDTTKARLIHTVSKSGEGGKNSAREDRQVWKTSSCRFQDQDIFAVSMWLRTGRVDDFAFCLSIPNTVSQRWGLPFVPSAPDHVTQNPPIDAPPAGPWTSDLPTICARVDELRDGNLEE